MSSIILLILVITLTGLLVWSSYRLSVYIDSIKNKVEEVHDSQRHRTSGQISGLEQRLRLIESRLQSVETFREAYRRDLTANRLSSKYETIFLRDVKLPQKDSIDDLMVERIL